MLCFPWKSTRFLELFQPWKCIWFNLITFLWKRNETSKNLIFSAKFFCYVQQSNILLVNYEKFKRKSHIFFFFCLVAFIKLQCFSWEDVTSRYSLDVYGPFNQPGSKAIKRCMLRPKKPQKQKWKQTVSLLLGEKKMLIMLFSEIAILF